jgi:hypothetical protein
MPGISYKRRLVTLLAFLVIPACASAAEMPWIGVSADKRGFVERPGNTPFVPWGFNYDRDSRQRLLEDYWVAEWPKVQSDFAEMKRLGANVVRIHLQFGKFMLAADKPNQSALDRLESLATLAENDRLYLDVTGLGCYHKADVPDWYDRLDEQGRWAAQCRFWSAVAERLAKSPAVFCYDLMNEPVVPGGKADKWVSAPYAGESFVEFITRDSKNRPRVEIARRWIRRLTAAIRQHDTRHLITVGMMEASLDRPGLTTGLVPQKLVGDLDFLSVHLYPKSGKVNDALVTLGGFSVGKPVLIEETYPLHCSMNEMERFIVESKNDAAGWIGFYWGEPPDELRRSKSLDDAVTLAWLELFSRLGTTIARPSGGPPLGSRGAER